MRWRKYAKTTRETLAGRLEQLESRILLAGDLVAHWRASELKDTVADGAVVSSWNDNAVGTVATGNGEPVLVHDGLGGRPVVRFSAGDGVDFFRVDDADSPLKQAQDYSIAVTFRTDSNDLVGGEGNWFANTGLVDGSQLGFTTDWGVTINADGKISSGLGESLFAQPKSLYSTQSGFNDGELHTAVVVRQSSNLTIYVDANNVGSRADVSAQNRSDVVDFVIGAVQTGTNGFTGDIGEVRVYNGALSAQEISQLDSDLASYYDNQMPVATADSYTLGEDSFFFSPTSVLANDADADGDPLTAVLISDVQQGELSLQATGSFVYTPRANFFGTDQFSYAANDIRNSEPVVVTLEVTPAYDPAVPELDQFKMLPSEVLQVPSIIGILANDLNPDRVTLTAVLVDDVNAGSLNLQADGGLTYDPQGFAGLATFSYKIDDGVGTSAAQQVEITVNTPPVAEHDQFSVNEDQSLVLSAAEGVLKNDTDADGNSVVVSLVEGPAEGTLELGEDGAVTYTPVPDSNGEVSFTYRLSDGIDDSGIATATITVEPVNDAPIALPDGYFLSPGEEINVSEGTGLLSNDTDIDSSSMTVVLVDGPATGTLELQSDGSFRYASAEGFTGTETFTYRASDGELESEVTEVSLLIGAPPVQISEFMAANLDLETRLRADTGSSFRGERSQPDWIEIKNLSNSSFDLSGYFLTDDDSNLNQWAFPAGTEIAANGYLVVYPSRLNVTNPDLDETGRYHTNFSLSLDGEYLAIASPDGVVLHEYANSYPDQRPGVSYGIAANGTTGYLTAATPGADNTGIYPGLVGDTRFSVDRGVYSEPISVEIESRTEGAEIRYTFDGSAPTASNGFVYSGPINIDRTTTLRAAAFFGDYLPSNVDTQTYIYLDQVVSQPGEPTTGPSDQQVSFPDRWRNARSNYEMDPEIINDPAYSGRMLDALLALPALSMTLDQDDVFGRNGLYSNPGSTAEKAASAELIFPDGTVGFQIDAGARMQGGASRGVDHVKHSMSLRFREDYGASNLEFPLYEDSPVTTFNSIHLRARYNNSWIHWSGEQRRRASMIREAWSRDAMLASGDAIAGHGSYVHLYLNGIYWGVYEMHERQDASHMAEYLGGDSLEYDARNANSPVDGTRDSYDEMRTIVRSKDWERIQQVLDIDNHILFNIVQLYGGNQDLKSDGNWRAAGGGSANAPWRYFMWDVERILENPRQRGTQPVSDLDGLRGQLDNIEEYRIRFADHVHRLLYNDGPLTPENAAALWMNRAEQLDLAIVAESARWGDTRQSQPFTRDDHWIDEQNRLMRDYFPVRTDNVISNFRRSNLYPDTDAPEFLVNDARQHGGLIANGDSVTFQNPNSGNSGQLVYTLDGSDPRQEGGEVAPGAIVYDGTPLPLTSQTQVKARILRNSEWSALTDATFVFEIAASAENLAITEINYNPHGALQGEPDVGGNAFEFIEVKNISDNPIDLSGVQFKQTLVEGDSEGIRFDFAPDVLAPGAHRVVVRDREAFVGRYGDTPAIALGDNGLGGEAGVWTGGRLGDGGETISLFAADGSVIRQVTYDDRAGWPERADSDGSSLVILDATLDANLGNNWRASDLVGGSPGSDSEPFAPDVVVNEILTNSDAPQVDQVELLNVSNQPVDISGWFLTDNPNSLAKFQFAADVPVLNPGDYVVIDENQLGFGFKGQANDDVVLLAGDESGPQRFVDSFRFLATETGVSLGRWDNGTGRLFPQVSSSFGAANAGPLLNGTIISELQYNPQDPDGDLTADDMEFVELWNPTGTPVDLSGWRLDRAVDFTFPQGTTVGANSGLVIVPFDPANGETAAAFRNNYGIAENVSLIGPFNGVLDNGGENLELQRPVADVENEFILVDRVRYDDDSPWPADADGQGSSLHRIMPDAYGDFVGSWAAASANPGQASFGANPADVNEDGVVDIADIDLVSAGVQAQDAQFDFDGNGQVNSDDLLDFVTTIMRVPVGDTDLDGVFNSTDLIAVFQVGEYEDGVAGNSTWGEGDWNADGEFDTSDLVIAFQYGSYQVARGPQAGVAAAIESMVESDHSSNRLQERVAVETLISNQPAASDLDLQARDLVFSDLDEQHSSKLMENEELKIEGLI